MRDLSRGLNTQKRALGFTITKIRNHQYSIGKYLGPYSND